LALKAKSATIENIDPLEIAKFEALAERWWDINSDFKPLHDINPLRLNYIEHHAPLAGKNVLDVGCGGGILAESMVVKGARVTGIDMGESPLSVAKLHGLESGIKVDYQQISAEQLAIKQCEKYDVITCLEMLEHVPDPASIIHACATMAKPGGALFFSTINRNPKSYFLAIIGAEYVLNILPRGTHDYQYFIRPSELSGWARESGLNIQDITGMTYNPLNKKYKLNTDVSVNYLVHCTKPA
jgi:2-polyprenyl-6-hydroxyphenyl methylase/3-demethylubiquinone-9 3-methyltransferase